jgi:hypothetical protein
MSHELRLTLCAPVDDEPEYFAEVSIVSGSGNHPWVDIYLEGVDVSAEGPRRLENARAVVRMWVGDNHFDVPYADVLAVLEQARTRLLVGESHVPPE